jgi:hypothetical protein
MLIDFPADEKFMAFLPARCLYSLDELVSPDCIAGQVRE